MRKAISLLLACVILITAWSPLTASAAFTPTFDVVSESAYLVNTDTGKVVYEKNKDKQLDPASLTKMMTCIIALEQIEDLEGTTATAPSYVFDELYGLNASNAGIMVNETLTMKDLLYALMLSSACEAAGIIADYISDGNPEQFVEMMNTKAKEIGCQNTVFKNPSGLEADGQEMCIRDRYWSPCWAHNNNHPNSAAYCCAVCFEKTVELGHKLWEDGIDW